MARHNFFEKLEREINIQFEYEKIENIVLNELNEYCFTLNDQIEENFYNWKFKKNYLSFEELRNYMGFTYSELRNGVKIATAEVKNIDDFILYCEMIYNMIFCVVADSIEYNFSEPTLNVLRIIQYDIEKMNHNIICLKQNEQYLIVQKNPAASAVADIVKPDLADSIIEYNHHLLKGKLKEKQLILKMIADALEPKRQELKMVDRKIESDFFYMVNCMNVRHNNCDASDLKKYNPEFAVLKDEQKESWYDEIYQEGLMAFLLLEQTKREKRIQKFKDSKVSSYM